MPSGRKVSLNLSAHSRRAANSRFCASLNLSAWQKTHSSRDFVFHSEHLRGERSLSCCTSDLLQLFYVCGIILFLGVKEAVDSLRLYGGVSIAQNWRKGGGPTAHPCGRPVIIYRLTTPPCSLIYTFNCAFGEVLKQHNNSRIACEGNCARTLARHPSREAFLIYGYFLRHSAAYCLFTAKSLYLTRGLTWQVACRMFV